MLYIKYIIGDLRGAGWSVRVVRENDAISDSDLHHVFTKVGARDTLHVLQVPPHIGGPGPQPRDHHAGAAAGVPLPLQTVPHRRQDGDK